MLGVMCYGSEEYEIYKADLNSEKRKLLVLLLERLRWLDWHLGLTQCNDIEMDERSTVHEGRVGR
jgi:hypothetical protein